MARLMEQKTIQNNNPTPRRVSRQHYSFHIGSIAVALSLSLALGCGDDTTTSDNTRSVTGLTECTVGRAGYYYIGVLAVLSDPAGQASNEMLDAVALAVDEVNAAGGINDLPVGYVICDAGTRANTETLEARFAEMAGASPISAMIGPLSSVETLALVPQIKTAGLPVIAPAAAAVDITTADDSGFLYRTVPTADAEGTMYGLWATEDGPADTAAFNSDAAAFMVPAAAFQTAVEANGGTTTIYNVDDLEPTDWQPAIATQAPEHVYIRVPSNTGDFVNLVKAAGISPQPEFTLQSTRVNAELITTVSDNAFLEGARGFTLVGKCAEPFQTNFTNRLGRAPGLVAQVSYDAAYAALTAMALASDAEDRDAVLAALAGSLTAATTPTPVGDWTAILADVADGEANLCGVATSVDFDSNGDVEPALFQEQTIRSGSVVGERCWGWTEQAVVTCP